MAKAGRDEETAPRSNQETDAERLTAPPPLPSAANFMPGVHRFPGKKGATEPNSNPGVRAQGGRHGQGQENPRRHYEPGIRPTLAPRPRQLHDEQNGPAIRTRASELDPPSIRDRVSCRARGDHPLNACSQANGKHCLHLETTDMRVHGLTFLPRCEVREPASAA